MRSRSSRHRSRQRHRMLRGHEGGTMRDRMSRWRMRELVVGVFGMAAGVRRRKDAGPPRAEYPPRLDVTAARTIIWKDRWGHRRRLWRHLAKRPATRGMSRRPPVSASSPRRLDIPANRYPATRTVIDFSHAHRSRRSPMSPSSVDCPVVSMPRSRLRSRRVAPTIGSPGNGVRVAPPRRRGEHSRRSASWTGEESVRL